ncbi:MAG: GGDEF domain-containing protein [Eggerthellaceae bacterium]|nr:GGDEF domain-containing protein [Eggerthellaceae bacterium]
MISNPQYCIAYLIVDAFCFALTLVALRSASQDTGSETQVRFFKLLLLSNLLFVSFDALWALLLLSGLFQPSSTTLSFVNGMALLFVVLCAYFWMCFTLAYFEHKLAYNFNMRLLAAAPVASAIVVHLYGIAVNQNVILSGDGTISYGFAHTAILLCAMFYLLVATITAIKRYLAATYTQERLICLVFISFMVGPVLAAVFDTLVPNSPIAAPAITLAIMVVILYLKDSRISTDGLTGLNNRRRTDTYLEASIEHTSPENPVTLFMIDIDKFKQINDNYGHLEGDRALRLVAETLRRVCNQLDAFAGRWGGDEFVIICTQPLDGGPQQVVESIHRSLSEAINESQLPYKLSCSVGYTACNTPNITANALLEEADRLLYEQKQ